MAITSADVLLVAPELSTLNGSQWTALLAQVYLQLDEDAWGDWLDLGATYLAAHLATMSKRAGTGGAVVSESVGSVSRSYAVAPTTAAMTSTGYGQEFCRLQNLLGAARGPWVI
jgi:hypothetical protein